MNQEFYKYYWGTVIPYLLDGIYANKTEAQAHSYLKRTLGTKSISEATMTETKLYVKKIERMYPTLLKYEEYLKKTRKED